MTSVALVVMTDGRRECIERSIPAALDNLKGHPITRRLICDDSGDLDYLAWLTENFPTFDLVTAWDRTGCAEAVRRAWMHAAACGDEQWVFWLEDDFIVERPVDLAAMAEVLTVEPQLSQMVLLRQAWFGNEVEAGGLIETDPSAYTDRCTAGHDWLEHRLGHWMNPHLVARSFLVDHEWPTGAWSEAAFSRQMRDEGRSSGFWGARGDAPLVTHVGERRGTGY